MKFLSIVDFANMDWTTADIRIILTRLLKARRDLTLGHVTTTLSCGIQLAQLISPVIILVIRS